MAAAALLCQPPQHLLVTNVCTRQHQRLRRSSRHRHWGLPPILVADHGHPSHILGHSAPAPHYRPHVSNNSRSPRLLVVMGRKLPVLQAHLPELTHQILGQLNTHSQAPPALQAAADAEAPAPPPAPAEGPFARGWQHNGSCTFKGRTFQRHPTSQPSTRHLPIRPFCEPSLHNHPLHQRLRIPVPPFPDPSPPSTSIAPSTVCTNLPVPSHFRLPRRPPRSLCPVRSILRSRGGPLERAAARVCREAGARVTTHTRLADLNVQHVQRIDDRRIEVIANGLALWGGAHTTLVSPLTRAGEPRRRAGRFAGAALTDARKPKSGPTPNSFTIRGAALSS